MNEAAELATNQAKRDFANGLGQNDNPYKRGTAERDAWMMEMGRLQNEEFRHEQRELRAGV